MNTFLKSIFLLKDYLGGEKKNVWQLFYEGDNMENFHQI